MSAGTGHDEHVLKLALIAFVGVDAVVAAEEHRHILGVDGTAEELDAVVQVVRDLDVVNGGTGANAGKGDAVDFVVLTNDRTTMVNADVRQDTRVVLGRTTTVRLTNDTFDAVCFGDGNSRAAIRSGDGSLAENDEATPKATLLVASKLSAVGSNVSSAVNVMGFLAVPLAMIMAPCSMMSAGASTPASTFLALMTVPASMVRVAPFLTNTWQLSLYSTLADRVTSA